MPFIGPIEKNVPIPDDKRRHKSLIMETLANCQVGDSFITTLGCPNVHTYAARLGLTVATKYHSPGRIRVWRLKDKPNGK